LRELQQVKTPHARLFRKELITRFPLEGLTEKHLKYYCQKVKGTLSLVIRQFRRRLEQGKRDLNQVKYLLLKRPENLSEPERNLLEAYLTNNPEFTRYRELSLRISDIYHAPHQLLKPSLIQEIKLWSDAHSDVKASVKTLKRNMKKIFNFISLSSKGKWKNAYRKVRITPESSMRKIKDVARKRFGFRTPKMSRLFLENELKCPVLIC